MLVAVEVVVVVRRVGSCSGYSGRSGTTSLSHVLSQQLPVRGVGRSLSLSQGPSRVVFAA